MPRTIFTWLYEQYVPYAKQSVPLPQIDSPDDLLKTLQHYNNSPELCSLHCQVALSTIKTISSFYLTDIALISTGVTSSPGILTSNIFIPATADHLSTTHVNPLKYILSAAGSSTIYTSLLASNAFPQDGSNTFHTQNTSYDGLMSAILKATHVEKEMPVLNYPLQSANALSTMEMKDNLYSFLVFNAHSSLQDVLQILISKPKFSMLLFLPDIFHAFTQLSHACSHTTPQFRPSPHFLLAVLFSQLLFQYLSLILLPGLTIKALQFNPKHTIASSLFFLPSITNMAILQVCGRAKTQLCAPPLPLTNVHAVSPSYTRDQQYQRLHGSPSFFLLPSLTTEEQVSNAKTLHLLAKLFYSHSTLQTTLSVFYLSQISSIASSSSVIESFSALSITTSSSGVNATDKGGESHAPPSYDSVYSTPPQVSSQGPRGQAELQQVSSTAVNLFTNPDDYTASRPYETILPSIVEDMVFSMCRTSLITSNISPSAINAASPKHFSPSDFDSNSNQQTSDAASASPTAEHRSLLASPSLNGKNVVISTIHRLLLSTQDVINTAEDIILLSRRGGPGITLPTENHEEIQIFSDHIFGSTEQASKAQYFDSPRRGGSLLSSPLEKGLIGDELPESSAFSLPLSSLLCTVNTKDGAALPPPSRLVLTTTPVTGTHPNIDMLSIPLVILSLISPQLLVYTLHLFSCVSLDPGTLRIMLMLTKAIPMCHTPAYNASLRILSPGTGGSADALYTTHQLHPDILSFITPFKGPIRSKSSPFTSNPPHATTTAEPLWRSPLAADYFAFTCRCVSLLSTSTTIIGKSASDVIHLHTVITPSILQQLTINMVTARLLGYHVLKHRRYFHVQPQQLASLSRGTRIGERNISDFTSSQQLDLSRLSTVGSRGNMDDDRLRLNTTSHMTRQTAKSLAYNDSISLKSDLLRLFRPSLESIIMPVFPQTILSTRSLASPSPQAYTPSGLTVYDQLLTYLVQNLELPSDEPIYDHQPRKGLHSPTRSDEAGLGAYPGTAPSRVKNNLNTIRFLLNIQRHGDPMITRAIEATLRSSLLDEHVQSFFNHPGFPQLSVAPSAHDDPTQFMLHQQILGTLYTPSTTYTHDLLSSSRQTTSTTIAPPITIAPVTVLADIGASAIQTITRFILDEDDATSSVVMRSDLAYVQGFTSGHMKTLYANDPLSAYGQTACPQQMHRISSSTLSTIGGKKANCGRSFLPQPLLQSDRIATTSTTTTASMPIYGLTSHPTLASRMQLHTRQNPTDPAVSTLHNTLKTTHHTLISAYSCASTTEEPTIGLMRAYLNLVNSHLPLYWPGLIPPHKIRRTGLDVSDTVLSYLHHLPKRIKEMTIQAQKQHQRDQQQHEQQSGDGNGYTPPIHSPSPYDHDHDGDHDDAQQPTYNQSPVTPAEIIISQYVPLLHPSASVPNWLPIQDSEDLAMIRRDRESEWHTKIDDDDDNANNFNSGNYDNATPYMETVYHHASQREKNDHTSIAYTNTTIPMIVTDIDDVVDDGNTKIMVLDPCYEIARLYSCSCGPCVGLAQAPSTPSNDASKTNEVSPSPASHSMSNAQHGQPDTLHTPLLLAPAATGGSSTSSDYHPLTQSPQQSSMDLETFPQETIIVNPQWPVRVKTISDSLIRVLNFIVGEGHHIDQPFQHNIAYTPSSIVDDPALLTPAHLLLSFIVQQYPTTHTINTMSQSYTISSKLSNSLSSLLLTVISLQNFKLSLSNRLWEGFTKAQTLRQVYTDTNVHILNIQHLYPHWQIKPEGAMTHLDYRYTSDKYRDRGVEHQLKEQYDEAKKQREYEKEAQKARPGLPDLPESTF